MIGDKPAAEVLAARLTALDEPERQLIRSYLLNEPIATAARCWLAGVRDSAIEDAQQTDEQDAAANDFEAVEHAAPSTRVGKSNSDAPNREQSQ